MDQKHIFAANVLLDLDECFAIRKSIDGAFAQFNADGIGDGLRERRIGTAGKNLHRIILTIFKNKKTSPTGPGNVDGTLNGIRLGAKGKFRSRPRR